MAKKMQMGHIVFVIGLVLAVLIALVSAPEAPAWAVLLIVVMGIVVGLLNITDKEVMMFLVASIAFLMSFQALSSVFLILAQGWQGVSVFFSLMSTFVAPAAAIVAVRALFQMAKS